MPPVTEFITHARVLSRTEVQQVEVRFRNTDDNFDISLIQNESYHDLWHLLGLIDRHYSVHEIATTYGIINPNTIFVAVYLLWEDGYDAR